MHAGVSFSHSPISLLLRQPLSIKKSYAGAIQKKTTPMEHGTRISKEDTAPMKHGTRICKEDQTNRAWSKNK
jgi:hypothetical protein